MNKLDLFRVSVGAEIGCGDWRSCEIKDYSVDNIYLFEPNILFYQDIVKNTINDTSAPINVSAGPVNVQPAQGKLTKDSIKGSVSATILRTTRKIPNEVKPAKPRRPERYQVNLL